MRSLVYILSACAVIALAFWAYRENYLTQRAVAESERLQQEIGAARARLAVLRAEWAYLNRPDRLRSLAELNYDTLQLLPLGASQFGQVDQVGFPPEPARKPQFDLRNSVDVSGVEEGR
ncbi:hypothetical protein SAMN04490248_11868 [Salinihabitans flavidus]|uniref:Cell division protein FtsL n=1 Tax=Salinihabitans flavidus TaxID=569882 RepID=A0A1H8U6L4_9RHOB|nr:cell division protein FtsL [Salinihabitans flavidus]SEO98910.1 hypothetical protein SAMN04490248_11868 [Salinihabitans flavidus]